MHDGPAESRTRSAIADGRRFPVLLALLLATFFILLPGCGEDPERARARGWKAGFEDGHRDGEREGYERGFERAFGESFDQTADQVPEMGDIRKSPFRTVVFVLIFLLLGFGAQYSALYLLRRGNILRDVDRILLGPKNASLTLKSLNPDQSLNPLLKDEPDGGFGVTPEDSVRDR